MKRRLCSLLSGAAMVIALSGAALSAEDDLSGFTVQQFGSRGKEEWDSEPKDLLDPDLR